MAGVLRGEFKDMLYLPEHDHAVPGGKGLIRRGHKVIMLRPFAAQGQSNNPVFGG